MTLRSAPAPGTSAHVRTDDAPLAPCSVSPSSPHLPIDVFARLGALRRVPMPHVASAVPVVPGELRRYHLVHKAQAPSTGVPTAPHFVQRSPEGAQALQQVLEALRRTHGAQGKQVRKGRR